MYVSYNKNIFIGLFSRGMLGLLMRFVWFYRRYILENVSLLLK